MCGELIGQHFHDHVTSAWFWYLTVADRTRAGLVVWSVHSMHELSTLRISFCEQTSWCLVFWVYAQQNTPAFLYGTPGRYILFRPYKAAFRIVPLSDVDPSRLTFTEFEYWGSSGRKRLPLTKIEIIVATNPPDLEFSVALFEKQWMRFLIPPRVCIVFQSSVKCRGFVFQGWLTLNPAKIYR